MFKCKMPPSTWFVQFVRKNYYAVFGQQDSKKPKKPYSGAEWPTRLDVREVCEKELFRFIWPERLRAAQKTGFQVQNDPLDLIRPVCEKELFRRTWPTRLQKS